MKRFVFCFLLPLFALVACTEKLDNNGIVDGKLTIQATFESAEEANTKTTLHSDGHIYWTPGDAISLFYGSGANGGSKFVSDIQEDNRVSSFSGTIGAVTGLSDDSADDLMFWGLYPYDSEASCDAQTVTVKILNEQEGMDDTFAPGYAPSLGRAPGLLLSFRSVYSGFYFTLTETGYQSITFRANNGEKITGTAKIGFDASGAPVVSEILSGTNAVTVTAPTNSGFAVGKKYYVTFFPTVLAGGFTVELRSASRVGTYVIDRSVNCKRNVINKVVDLDTKCTFESAGNTEPIEGGNDPDINW